MNERSGGTAFIGFTYGGEHSIDTYGVYRTSDGSRYNTNMIPSLTEKTADVPGGDGQYYFYTKYKTRQFSIPIAFDELEEEKFYEMKQWLNGKEIKELTFDENVDIHYSAKVTGTPQLKTICFEEEYTETESGEEVIKKRNIYKGEGTIQFTCYFPFGWTNRHGEVTGRPNFSQIEFDINV
jgi:predicted phage tail component-like protein